MEECRNFVMKDDGKFYDESNGKEVSSNEVIKYFDLDVDKKNEKMSKSEIAFVTTVFSLAAYGGYGLYKSISGFFKRKINPNKELQKEIERLKRLYPDMYIDVNHDYEDEEDSEETTED